MSRGRQALVFPSTLLTVAVATCLLAGCEPVQNARPATVEQEAISVPVPLPEPPPIVTSDLPPEDSAPLTGPSKAPLPAEGDILTSGQVLDRLRARLSSPTCIVGPNNTRWRHKYAGYPQHFADEVVATLPMMLVVLDELETHHLPAEFALIPIVESWYRPETHSFGGAAGMWQLLAETARNNGATVTGGYDGRLSTLDATDAAMNYLGKLQGMFNDWRLTAMAYNSGEYRLAKTMSPDELAARGVGGVHYRRPGGLAFGTYEYVSKMRALDCLLAQPQRLGIPFDPSVPITHWIPYTMPADIDSLDELARRLGIDAETLKAFNHGYHNGRVGADAPRTLLVPAGSRSRWASAGSPAQQVPASMPTAINVAPSAPLAGNAVSATSAPAMSASRPMQQPAAADTSRPPPSTATGMRAGMNSPAPAGTPPAGHPLPSFAPPSSTAPPMHGAPGPTPLAPNASTPGVPPQPAPSASATTGISSTSPPIRGSQQETGPAGATLFTASPDAATPKPTSSAPANTALHDAHAPPNPASTSSPSTTSTAAASHVPVATPMSSAPTSTAPASAIPASAAPISAAPSSAPTALNAAMPAGSAPVSAASVPQARVATRPVETTPTSAAASPTPPASATPQTSSQAGVAASSSAASNAPGASTTITSSSTSGLHQAPAAVVPGQSPMTTAPAPLAAPTASNPTAAPSSARPTVPAATARPAIAAPSSPATAIAPVATRTYKVQLGDSLETIAQHFGVSAADLRTWNHLAPDAPLYVDERLRLEP